MEQVQAPGPVSRFQVGEQSMGNGVHTFTSVPNEGDGSYLGFSGPLYPGPIDLYESADGREWNKLQSDIIQAREVRWVTATVEKGRIYLVGRENVDGVRGVANQICSMNGRFDHLQPWADTELHLYEMTSKKEVEHVCRLVGKRQTGSAVNQNPNLTRVGDSVILVFHTMHDGDYQVRVREASSVRSLQTADETVILSSPNLVAAPSLYHIRQRDRFILFAEEMDEQRSQWITTAYTTSSITEPVDSDTQTVLFQENEACPIPIEGDQTYLFTTKCRTDIDAPEIEGEWEGRLHPMEDVLNEL